MSPLLLMGISMVAALLMILSAIAALSATHHQKQTRAHDVMESPFFFLQWPRNPVAAACLLAYTDANVALLTLTVGADVAGWMGPDNPASFTKQRA